MAKWGTDPDRDYRSWVVMVTLWGYFALWGVVMVVQRMVADARTDFRWAVVYGISVLALWVFAQLMIWRNFLKPLRVSEPYRATVCGHLTALNGLVEAFGEKRQIRIRPTMSNTVSLCHRCVEERTIRCAWCGQPIFVGDPVTLHSPADSNCHMPAHAVPYEAKGHRAYVGCLRFTCADTGGDRFGFWSVDAEGKGFVHRVA